MDSSLDNNRKHTNRPQGRPKGQPKSGGRTVGTPNKSTAMASLKFQQACTDHNFDFGKELIESLKVRDFDYSKILISIMDYYFGKVSPYKAPDENDQEDDLNKEIPLNKVF